MIRMQFHRALVSFISSQRCVMFASLAQWKINSSEPGVAALSCLRSFARKWNHSNKTKPKNFGESVKTNKAQSLAINSRSKQKLSSSSKTIAVANGFCGTTNISPRNRSFLSQALVKLNSSGDTKQLNRMLSINDPSSKTREWIL